jgi:hypothetical protein
MGYTNYWTCHKAKHGNAKKAEETYQLAIRQCQRVVKSYNKQLKALDPKHPARLSGYTAHCDVSEYGGLNVNGVADLACESFTMREHWNENTDFDFCKTNERPYDVVVKACLLIMKHYMGDLIEISADDGGDQSDWMNAYELVERVTKIKGLPAVYEIAS